MPLTATSATTMNMKQNPKKSVTVGWVKRRRTK